MSDDLCEVGGEIADVERWTKHKLPFVHVEHGVAYDRTAPGGGTSTVKFSLPTEAAARAQLDHLAARGVANPRLIRRQYSDWTVVAP